MGGHTESPDQRTRRRATAGGFLAIVLWSTTIAFTRSLSEQVGSVTAGAAVCVASGVLSVVWLLLFRDLRHALLNLPRRPLLACGALFLPYMLVLFLAIGLAHGREQVLEIGLVNYLWPTLTILFSVALLGVKANGWIVPGTALGLTGVFIVMTHDGAVSPASFVAHVASNPPAYALALAAAVSWALYSTLTRRWSGGHKGGAVLVFLPAAAVALVILAACMEEPRAWTPRAFAETGVLGTATFVAYRLWDSAMRLGNVMRVATASYLTPLLSTIVSCVYLGIVARPILWVGCGLLIAGSLVSWWSTTGTGDRRPSNVPT